MDTKVREHLYFVACGLESSSDAISEYLRSLDSFQVLKTAWIVRSIMQPADFVVEMQKHLQCVDRCFVVEAVDSGSIFRAFVQDAAVEKFLYRA